MAVYKDGDRWRVIYRYTNWDGVRKQTQKRGFLTKRDAQSWEHEMILKQQGCLDMTFESFFEIYKADKLKRLKVNTWATKEHMVRTKIMPYFGWRKIAEIEVKDVITWQNKMLKKEMSDGENYSQTYLKSIHAQLSAIFNHAVRYYHLRSNPAALAGTMGSEEHKEMLFWTKEEYLRFAEEMMDKPQSYYAFEMLYWCGIRLGELLALTLADFDFNKKTLRINKSYQRLKGQDYITSPKTAKSNRIISMPQFLCDEMQDYIGMLYEVSEDDRIFTMTKSYMHHEMDRGAKAAGVKRIRIHDLRHSHVSFLIEMGFSALAIAERVGHESIVITYRYAHLFPTKQKEMADRLDQERMEAEEFIGGVNKAVDCGTEALTEGTTDDEEDDFTDKREAI